MRGFTLVEMLVIVALLGILTALSAASLGPLATRYRLLQGAELVSEEVYQARAWARETGRCHLIEVLDGTARAGAGLPGDALRIQRRVNTDCDSAPGPASLEVVELVHLPPNVKVLLPDGESAPVWRPNGRLAGPAMELLVGRMVDGAFEARSAIRIQPQGPVCVADPVSPGRCP